MAASPKHLVLPPSFASSYTDKYAHGPYSYAPPGRVPLRAALAEPVSNRPFFAGEATSTDLHSSLNGARITGTDVANAAIAGL